MGKKCHCKSETIFGGNYCRRKIRYTKSVEEKNSKIEYIPWRIVYRYIFIMEIIPQEKLGDNGVLFYPSAPFPASYHYSSYLRPFNFGYWCLFNVLRFPTCQVPMGLDEQGLPVGIQVRFLHTTIYKAFKIHIWIPYFVLNIHISLKFYFYHMEII